MTLTTEQRNNIRRFALDLLNDLDIARDNLVFMEHFDHLWKSARPEMTTCDGCKSLWEEAQTRVLAGQAPMPPEAVRSEISFTTFWNGDVWVTGCTHIDGQYTASTPVDSLREAVAAVEEQIEVIS